MQRRRRNAARNEGFSATDSPRALISLVAIVSSFAHDGTRPQRRRWITRSPFDRWRTTGSHCIGAAFQRGSNSKPGASGRGGEASTVPLAADSDVAMAASSTGCPTIFIVDLEEGDVDAPTHEGPGARRSSGAA